MSITNLRRIRKAHPAAFVCEECGLTSEFNRYTCPGCNLDTHHYP